ncbi:hypothetical protein FRC12_009937 [Ceratobasidium sp. 428]|nr:hypothetical protein FRC12_009937 [Ceratobasidium sp. 428]
MRRYRPGPANSAADAKKFGRLLSENDHAVRPPRLNVPEREQEMCMGQEEEEDEGNDDKDGEDGGEDGREDGRGGSEPD